MIKTYYDNGIWGRYHTVYRLGRIGYAELVNRQLKANYRRVIFYIK